MRACARNAGSVRRKRAVRWENSFRTGKYPHESHAEGHQKSWPEPSHLAVEIREEEVEEDMRKRSRPRRRAPKTLARRAGASPSRLRAICSHAEHGICCPASSPCPMSQSPPSVLRLPPIQHAQWILTEASNTKPRTALHRRTPSHPSHA
jgi:hypothetical protein